DAVSLTGSTHRRLPRRVTKDRVAASGARLHDGQEVTALVPSAPHCREASVELQLWCAGDRECRRCSTNAFGCRCWPSPAGPCSLAFRQVDRRARKGWRVCRTGSFGREGIARSRIQCAISKFCTNDVGGMKSSLRSEESSSAG